MRSVMLAATIAFALTGCNDTVQDDGPRRVTGVEWIAETINGKPVIEPGGVTLTFSDERVTGRSGCNRYFGAAEHGGGKLKIGSVGATKMACLRDGLMSQESEYLTALQTSQTYAFRGDRLVLSGSSSELVFTGSTPPQ
ncbi:MAG: META domain-containing protein [Micropepsaceae bacterium]